MNDFFRTEERGGGWAGGGGVRSQTYFEGRHRTLGGGDDASKLPFSVTYKWGGIRRSLKNPELS